MAKSLRSKWKRKMKAEKRKRYAVKELAQLKTALATKDQSSLVEWVDIKKRSKRPPSIRKQLPAKRKSLKDVSTHIVSTLENTKEVMEVDETPKIYDKNLRDQNGSLPVWLHPRKVKKLKANKKKGKGKKKGGATW